MCIPGQVAAIKDEINKQATWPHLPVHVAGSMRRRRPGDEGAVVLLVARLGLGLRVPGRPLGRHVAAAAVVPGHGTVPARVGFRRDRREPVRVLRAEL